MTKKKTPPKKKSIKLITRSEHPDTKVSGISCKTPPVPLNATHVELAKPYTIDEASEDGRRIGYAQGYKQGYEQGQESGVITGIVFGVIGMFILGIVVLWAAR